MAKYEITTIVKKADECVVYHDDGMYCSWTETKKFSLELLNNIKAGADGMVLLVSEAEAQEFAGEHMKFENHSAWTISRDLIWVLYGELEARESEIELVNFLKSLQI